MVDDIDNYLAIEGIDPSLWGKCGWIFLFSVALTYKKEKKDYYKKLFESLPYLLPCSDCGEKLKKEMPKLNDALESKKSLLIWLAKIRNNVAKQTNGRQLSTKNMIFEIFNNNKSNTFQYIIIFVLILAIVLFALIFRRCKNKSNSDEN